MERIVSRVATVTQVSVCDGWESLQIDQIVMSRDAAGIQKVTTCSCWLPVRVRETDLVLPIKDTPTVYGPGDIEIIILP